MISPQELAGPAAALVAGLVTSLHCVGMCGPLACAACSNSGEPAAQWPAVMYHSTRLLGYTAVGFAAGAIGKPVADVLLGGSTRGMTLLFALFFLAVAVGLDKRLRVPQFTTWFSRAFAKTQKLGPCGRAGTLGALTPLLPCAPLYLVVGAAALSGSGLSGAALMVMFGAGTVPLLFLVQNRLTALGGKWSPQRMDLLRRGLAMASVILLVVRSTYTASTGCPMCP
ncbi:MAG: sulfite exporter TauE/SafE family protein [Terrimicrobiaceae bacterium]